MNKEQIQNFIDQIRRDDFEDENMKRVVLCQLVEIYLNQDDDFIIIAPLIKDLDIPRFNTIAECRAYFLMESPLITHKDYVESFYERE
jgi:hypothetical protein